MVSDAPRRMTAEQEFVAADAVRVECFARIRVMLREGSEFCDGAEFQTWMLRYLAACDAQVRALEAIEREENECAS